jgi:hypothetical protein
LIRVYIGHRQTKCGVYLLIKHSKKAIFSIGKGYEVFKDSEVKKSISFAVLGIDSDICEALLFFG